MNNLKTVGRHFDIYIYLLLYRLHKKCILFQLVYFILSFLAVLQILQVLPQNMNFQRKNTSMAFILTSWTTVYNYIPPTTEDKSEDHTNGTAGLFWQIYGWLIGIFAHNKGQIWMMQRNSGLSNVRYISNLNLNFIFSIILLWSHI